MTANAKVPSRQLRYQRLADALIGAIRSGSLKVGATLPGEHELVAQHGVSRHTVREALRRLTDLGLIERRRGIGTVVRARRPTQSYSHTVRSPAELLRYPADSRLYVHGVETVAVSRALARELGLAGSDRWVRVSALRRLRNVKVPICWVDIYILPEYGAVADLIGRRGQLVYELIEQQFGEKLATVEVGVHAELVPVAMADALQVAAGSPSLRIVRRYVGQAGRVFQVTVSHHPADRYSFALELRRGWQAGGSAPST
jgi:DNA-binding GntR family transcriptional regulator